jgi:hypothetical protein
MFSAWAPYALPDRQNPLAANQGQGCVGGLAAIGALFVDMVIMVPVFVVVLLLLATTPLAVATVASIAFASVYGAISWRIGRHVAARHLWWRMPELLDAVSPRHAG